MLRSRLLVSLLSALGCLEVGCLINRGALSGDGGDPPDASLEGTDAPARPDADRDAYVPMGVDANVCGDGNRTGSEMCDDGNRASGDGCTPTCAAEPGFNCTSGECFPVCGDGIVVGSETCDDNNGNAADGCSATCTVEPSFVCIGLPSVCTRACGNGRINAGEACDDGARATGDGCSAECTLESGFTCAGTPSVCMRDLCGNGAVDSGEQCDDGMRGAGDGCSPMCQREPGASCIGGGLTVATGSLDVGIPDEGVRMVTLPGTLPATCRPARVRYVTIDLRHTYISDLTVTVTNPTGSSVDLFRRPGQGVSGAEGRDLDGAYRFFSNDMVTPFPGTGGGAVPPGNYNTVNASGARTLVLQTFMGAPGAWTLAVADAGRADVGTLRNAQIGVYCTPNP